MCFLLLPSGAFAATTPGNSTYDDYANSLAPLGVFVGTGSGYELNRAPTRIEGLVMLIRLLGVEDEAMAMKGSKIPFTDVPKWASGYVAYAYNNDLSKGISTTKFGSANNMEAKAFVTFLLRSLNYRDAAGDFSYTNALSFANGINLLNDSTYSTLTSSGFLRAYVAKTAYDALKFHVKGTEVTLINKLMAENKINAKVGNDFIALVLTEPSGTIKPPGNKIEDSTIEISKNADSVVMILADLGDSIGQGSGVIISADGTIVTNYHVIEGANSLTVTFNDGTKYSGSVYVQDYNESLDLAILKINKAGLRPVVIGNSDSLRQGEEIVVIGSPYGFFNSVTEGIISAIRTNDIQVSAAMNHGNSGGGLFNSKGQLVGIPYEGVDNANNLGFAIPINKLSKLTAKNMTPISAFGNSSITNNTAKILPPTNIRIVEEESNSVHINWDPAKNADYYYFYYQSDGDDTYWYDEDQGKQMKFYYKSYSSILYYDLTPGYRYNLYITSVSDGVESDASKVFSFVKGYGNNNVFYKNDYGVPDFGIMFGIRLDYGGNGSYFYKSSDIRSGYTDTYIDSLKANGFYYSYDYKDDDYNTVIVYRNNVLGKTVMMGYATINRVRVLHIFIPKN